MKDAGLRIRLDSELREKFVRTCQAHDLTAAQVLRDFMRHFVEKYDGTLQLQLLAPESDSKQVECNNKEIKQ